MWPSLLARWACWTTFAKLVSVRFEWREAWDWDFFGGLLERVVFLRP